MENQKIQQLKDTLIKQKTNVENTIGQMKENKAAEQDKYSTTELSNYDNHPAELGTEVFQTEMNNALRVHEEYILNEIDEALHRIDEGTFGKCALCGKDIGLERLEALPYTEVCIECANAKKLEPEIAEKSRPNEELIWDAPFGRKYLNRREDDEHEGMDQLNDLMKYGSADSPQDMGGYEDFEEYYTNEIDKQGLVDRMDAISNEEYKRQLPD
ncbi:MAG: TraR/DksA C4-type zinc finger protein [Clostridia bacterium]|nr:TraR/DksA C4-type zinc finger protein [Clostridia bacterium]